MTKKEFSILIVAAVLLIAVAVTITASVYYFQLSVAGQEDANGAPVVAGFQLGQAVPVCDKEIISRYGSSIHTKTFDNISSRFDASRDVHLIFGFVSLKKSGDIFDYSIVCTISGSTNRLEYFEILPMNERSKFQIR